MTSNEVCASPLTASSMPITLSVYSITPVTVTAVGATLVSSAATGNQWYEQTFGMLVGENDQIYTPVVNGNYYVMVTDNNGCVTTSNVFNFMTVGVNEASNDPNFSYFPNPTNGKITITFRKNIENGKILIENALGQKVFEDELNQIAGSTRMLDFSNYATGVYFVIIRENGMDYKQKVMFERN
jgi:hypothetical protein